MLKEKRVLWLTHKRELVDQAASRMPIPCGVILAGREPTEARVQIASVQTITARELHPPADLLVLDEAHRATAETWRAIIQAYPKAWCLGLTATPERGDGAALGDVFDTLVEGPTVKELIALGQLVPCEVFAPVDEGGTLAADPVAAWKQYAGDRQGFVFAKTIEHSREIAAALGGIHIDGETPTAVRDLAISQFRAGTVRVLCSVFVFTEGFDAPMASVCLLARGCGHAGAYIQMVGRVMRPYPGKDRCTVVDLKGAVHRHGLPDDDRTYSLEGTAIKRKGEASVRQCPECGACFEPAPDCPRCGYVFPPPEPPTVKVREMKRALRPHGNDEQKKKTWARLSGAARTNGYKAGWAKHRFRATYGHWPPREW